MFHGAVRCFSPAVLQGKRVIEVRCGSGLYPVADDGVRLPDLRDGVVSRDDLEARGGREQVWLTLVKAICHAAYGISYIYLSEKSVT